MNIRCITQADTKVKYNQGKNNRKKIIRIEFIFNKRERCIFLGVLVATTFKSWIMIQIENDFSQKVLAKAIIRLDFHPPAKAGGNQITENKPYIILSNINSIQNISDVEIFTFVVLK